MVINNTLQFIKRSTVAGICLALAAVQPAAAQERQTDTLTLREAVRQALARSPLLAASQDVRETATIQHRAASARFAPRISPILSTGTGVSGMSERELGVAVSQLLSSGAQIDGSLSTMRYGSGAGALRDAGYTIGVSQPLMRGFGVTTRAEIDSADHALRAAERGESDARQQLVVQVAQAYFNVVRQQRLAVETERALERAVKLGEMSEARARVGLSTKLDVLRAGLLRSQAQAAALRDGDALDAVREELNILVGRAPDAPCVADDEVEIERFAASCLRSRYRYLTAQRP